MTLAMEGVCGALRLADHDQLELSNMNRVRAGVHEIGSDKTAIVARQIWEIDPYPRLSVPVSVCTRFFVHVDQQSTSPLLHRERPVGWWG